MIIDNLIDCLTGDASLNNMLSGGIRHLINDTDRDNSKNWLTFKLDKTSGISTTNGVEAVSYHQLSVQCISPSDTTALNMAEELTNYLKTYDDGKIRSAKLIDDGFDYDGPKKVWFKTNIYELVYVG